MKRDRPKPVVRRQRRASEKPPMLPALKAEAGKAIARHRKRHLNPGVAVEVEKLGNDGYRIASPHNDQAAWIAMVCDALGTRSESTAKVFVHQLTKLCSMNWLPSDVEGEAGEWCPDETELNMILNLVTSIKPKNEMQAALGAQMVAVHLMTMRASEEALGRGMMDIRTAAVAGKLARTFTMMMDALDRSKGRKTTRQKITVSYERHEHKHVHVHRGEADDGGRPHGSTGSDAVGNYSPPLIEHEGSSAMPGETEGGRVVPLRRSEREEGLLHARRGKRLGRAES